MERNEKQNEIRYYTEKMLKALILDCFREDMHSLLDSVEHYAWVRATYCKEIKDPNLREEYEWLVTTAERVIKAKCRQIAANADGNFLLETVVKSICDEYRFHFTVHIEE